MKSTKKICETVQNWALEICHEDGQRHLLQQVDGVIPDGEHIKLHVCDVNYQSVLESIEVHGVNGTLIYLTDNANDKTCLYTLRECDDFEPREYCLSGCPGSKFFTDLRLAELRIRIKDLPEKTASEKSELHAIMNELKTIAAELNIPIVTAHQLNEEKIKYKSDDIKEISDPNKHTTLMNDSDIVEIVRRWVCDICHESRFNLLHRHDTDGVGFDLIRPVSGFYRVTAVVKKLGNGFDIIISDIIPGGVARVMCKATGEVDVTMSGSFKMITHDQVSDLVNRLRCSINNSTVEKKAHPSKDESTPSDEFIDWNDVFASIASRAWHFPDVRICTKENNPVKDSFSLPRIFTRPLNKIKSTTLTHDIIDKASRSGPGWYFDTTSISDKYDVLDADAQYRKRINYLIDRFGRLCAEHGSIESALSWIPNVPLEEYGTRKFPIRRKLVLPTIETIDGKTVMHFKVYDLSERVIKKYSDIQTIPFDAVNEELDSKSSMFNIFDQSICTRPSDEVLCYAIENMALRNPYGIRAVPDEALNYCSMAKLVVLLNISSAELKDLSEEEVDDIAEYLRRHDVLTPYGGGSSVNGIILKLITDCIDKTKRTLEHDVVVIDNSSVLHAAVKITQLVNMVINGDITLGWMKRHKSGELEIADPTLADKVAACFRK